MSNAPVWSSLSSPRYDTKIILFDIDFLVSCAFIALVGLTKDPQWVL